MIPQPDGGPTVKGGAALKAERADLPPDTVGRQALRIDASGAGSRRRSSPTSTPRKGSRFCASKAGTG